MKGAERLPRGLLQCVQFFRETSMPSFRYHLNMATSVLAAPSSLIHSFSTEGWLTSSVAIDIVWTCSQAAPHRQAREKGTVMFLLMFLLEEGGTNSPLSNSHFSRLFFHVDLGRTAKRRVENS